MAGINVDGEDKASEAPVGLPVKRTKKRSGKRWGSDLNDPSTTPPSGAQALAGNVGQAAAAGPHQEPGAEQSVQKSRKPRHKRWGPDKDLPDPIAEEPEQEAAPAAASEPQIAGSLPQQKPKRKRWGPDAPAADPEPPAADPEPAKQAEQPAPSPEQRGKRKRWGPDEAQGLPSAPTSAPLQEAQAADAELGASEGAASRKYRKRRWGPDEPPSSVPLPAAEVSEAKAAVQASLCAPAIHSWSALASLFRHIPV